MRLFISISILIMFGLVQASEIRIVYTKPIQQLMARDIQQYFTVSYQIPESLTQVIQSRACGQVDRRYLELCIDEKNDLIFPKPELLEEKIRSLEIFFKN